MEPNSEDAVWDGHTTMPMSLEERLEVIEERLERNSKVLIEIIRHLERRDGHDLDGDGRIG